MRIIGTTCLLAPGLWLTWESVSCEAILTGWKFSLGPQTPYFLRYTTSGGHTWLGLHNIRRILLLSRYYRSFAIRAPLLTIPELCLQEIACYMGLNLGQIKIKRFADGEIYVQLEESVRGCDVFLVQPTCPPANENLMELLVMIDACRRASAKTITAVIPYFGYARADRKVRRLVKWIFLRLSSRRCYQLGTYLSVKWWSSKQIFLLCLNLAVFWQTQGRESIAAKLAANLITEAGAHRVLTCDLHSGQAMGYFDIPVDHVYGQPVILDYLASKMISAEDLVVVSPDVGGVARARAFAKKLSDAPLAIVDKRRQGHNVSEV